MAMPEANIWKAEEGGSVAQRLSLATERVPGQPGVHETLKMIMMSGIAQLAVYA